MDKITASPPSPEQVRRIIIAAATAPKPLAPPRVRPTRGQTLTGGD